MSIRGPGKLLKVYCPLQPIVTVTRVLECSPRRAEKAQRRRKKRTEVGLSGWAVPPRGGQKSPMGQKGHKDSLYPSDR